MTCPYCKKNLELTPRYSIDDPLYYCSRCDKSFMNTITVNTIKRDLRRAATYENRKGAKK